jgi:hypothetical protein
LVVNIMESNVSHWDALCPVHSLKNVLPLYIGLWLQNQDWKPLTII